MGVLFNSTYRQTTKFSQGFSMTGMKWKSEPGLIIRNHHIPKIYCCQLPRPLLEVMNIYY